MEVGNSLKPIILIIDDSPMMCQFMARFLRKEYDVTACQSPLEALELVQKGFRPNLIVTDLEMPELSGINLIRAFQNNYPAIPLIVVSGLKESQHRLEALDNGASDFLAKPFHPEELAIRISRVLQEKVA